MWKIKQKHSHLEFEWIVKGFNTKKIQNHIILYYIKVKDGSGF